MKFKVVDKKIPEKLYRQIYASIPIACTDIIVVRKGKPRAFLMARRKNHPAKGQWWFPGGRILKNEKMHEAAKRLLKEEIGVSAARFNIMGVDDLLIPDGFFPGLNIHNIAIVTTTEISPRASIRLDNQNSEWRWFTKIDPKWHPYLKKFLRKAGFR